MGPPYHTNLKGKPRHLRASLLLLFTLVTSATAQQMALQIDPQQTSVRFSLDAALHSVHGSFQAKPGSLQFNPGSGVVFGQIVIDAKSGQTGIGIRDRKMHKDVIESATYPEITFRPDRITGAVILQGKSSPRVHGMIRIHGVDREIEVPVAFEMNGDRWTANVHFTLPYAKWGMRNPSTLFLRVSDSVEIDLSASGSVSRDGTAPPSPSQ